ncbi:hypothetical protein OESDEN_07754 [Oesophagostomum dentatum]|uniref:Uncharacterized protein n=1 Tax=Oesophagostomum dentatum TaxID=61180 RepID=A0A0B1T885_OESDE|nr:hypothetical protein OESDEN_07754 [Oesophagostomum dentatum]
MFLITKGKTKEAEAWIRRMQRFGGRKFECDVLRTIENETAKLPEETTLLESLRHVVHSSKLMLYLTIQTTLWVIDFMIYNALSLTSTDELFDTFQDEVFPGFMFTVFAVLCGVGAAITTFLPETKQAH